MGSEEGEIADEETSTVASPHDPPSTLPHPTGAPLPTAQGFVDYMREHLVLEDDVPPWSEDAEFIPSDSLLDLQGLLYGGVFPTSPINDVHFARVPILFWIRAWNFSRRRSWRESLFTAVRNVGILYRTHQGYFPAHYRPTARGIIRDIFRPRPSRIRRLIQTELNQWRQVGVFEDFLTLSAAVPMPDDNTLEDEVVGNGNP